MVGNTDNVARPRYICASYPSCWSAWKVEDCATSRPRRQGKIDVFQVKDGYIVGSRELYHAAAMMAHNFQLSSGRSALVVV